MVDSTHRRSAALRKGSLLTKSKVPVVMIILPLVAFLLGCKEGIPEDDYNTAVAQRDAVKAQVSSLEGQLNDARSDLNTVQNDLARVKGEHDRVLSDLLATGSEMELVKRQTLSAQSAANLVQSELRTVQEKLEAAQQRITELETVHRLQVRFRLYGVEKLGLSYVAKLKALDEDGEVDEHEKGFIDYLRRISSLVPQEVRHYYTDGEVVSLQEALIGSVLSDDRVSIAEAAALRYLQTFERWNIQRDVIHSGMIDEAFLGQDWDGDSFDNIIELKKGTNPLNELETDPSNPSERYAVVAALSNVFHDREDSTILVPTDLISHDALEFYHLLRRNGYDDNHIYLFLYHIDQKMRDIGPGIPVPTPIPNSVSGWLENADSSDDDVDGIDDYILPDDDPLWEGDDEWAGKNLLTDLGPVRIDYENEDVTIEKFLDVISNMPTDDNDVIFIYYASHGVGTSTPGEGAIAFTAGPESLDGYWYGFKLYDIFARHYLLNKAILNIGDYGRIVIMQDGCNTGAVLKDLNKTDADQDYRNGIQPSPIRNTLALSATLPDESQSGVGFGHYFLNILRQNPYKSIAEAFREADLIEDKSSDATDEHSVMYYFDIGVEEGTSCAWADSYSFVAYSPTHKRE